MPDSMMGSLTRETTEERIAGRLLVKYDPVHYDENGKLKFVLRPGKQDDAGLDLPVVVDERLKIQPHMDYYINLKEQWFDIPPNGQAEIPCGLSVKVPVGTWGNIRARSSTEWRRRLTVTHGCIDGGFTGALFILVRNPNNQPVRVKAGERLAQLVIITKPTFTIETTTELPKTERGQSGFGSTGK
jgi:dUTP pyrophosphatase